MEAFAATLTAAQRRKLDAAVDSLMDREDIAETYEHLKGSWTGLTPVTRHLITDENRKWWTLGAMCFALFMIMLDNTVVNVALPSIQRDLGASISGLEWTINGYTLSFAVLLATGGRLGDIFGRRRMFLFGVVIFALSSATAGLRPGLDRRWSISRVVQGVGAGADDARRRSRSSPTPSRAQRARQGDGDLGRRLRPGPGDRPGAGRLPHRARQLAGDLLPQHPGRDRGRARRRCSPCASRATPRSVATSTTPASPSLTAGLTALVLALVEGNSWGWGSTAIIALLVDRRGRAARLRRRSRTGSRRRWSSSTCSRIATSSARWSWP